MNISIRTFIGHMFFKIFISEDTLMDILSEIALQLHVSAAAT